jgi:hypothetical protein
LFKVVEQFEQYFTAFFPGKQAGGRERGDADEEGAVGVASEVVDDGRGMTASDGRFEATVIEHDDLPRQAEGRFPDVMVVLLCELLNSEAEFVKRRPAVGR